MKKALVLSGGAIRGAFEAGALKAVLESGYIPDVVCGISVGTLNGAYITASAGTVMKAKGKLSTQDWATIGDDLAKFWIAHIKKPADIAKPRFILSLLFDLIFKKFNGLMNTDPVIDLMKKYATVENMRLAPFKFMAGTVDFLTSDLIYVDQFNPDFLNYSIGSISMPILMPPAISKKGDVLYDGGTRETAPLNHAINLGAVNILAIMCYAEKNITLQEGTTFHKGNLQDLMTRLTDIIANESVLADSKWIRILNNLLTEAEEKGYTLKALQKYSLINHLIIQPDVDLTISNLTFNSEDIKSNIDLGYKTAKKRLQASSFLTSQL